MTDRELKPEELSSEELPEEIEQFLAEVGSHGYQVAIRRVAPDWCKGYLDTWSLDEPFKLRTLRDVFGGKKFMCRIMDDRGKYVRSFTVDVDDEPKRDGMILKRFPTETPPVQFIGTQPEHPSPDLRILEMLEQTRREQINFLTSLLLKDRATADPLAQMKSAAQMTSALREMAQSFGEGGESEGSTGLILKTLLAIMEKKQVQPQPQPQRRPQPQVLHPRPQARPAPVPQAASPRPKPTTMAPCSSFHQPATIPNPAPEPEGEPDIIDQLLDLEPKDAGEAFAEYLEQLPEEEAKIVIASAMGMPADDLDLNALSDTFKGSGLESLGNETSPASPASVHRPSDTDQTEDDAGTVTENDPLDRAGNCQRE